MVEENKEKKKSDDIKAKKLQKLGFEPEHAGEVLF